MNPCPRDINGRMHVLALNEVDHAETLEVAMSMADYFGVRIDDDSGRGCKGCRAMENIRSGARDKPARDRAIGIRVARRCKKTNFGIALSFKTTSGVAKRTKGKKPKRSQQFETRKEDKTSGPRGARREQLACGAPCSAGQCRSVTPIERGCRRGRRSEIG
jgi:hypothetical protein